MVKIITSIIVSHKIIRADGRPNLENRGCSGGVEYRVQTTQRISQIGHKATSFLEAMDNKRTVVCGSTERWLIDMRYTPL